MFIKKPKLILGIIAIVLISSLSTLFLINPFGVNIGKLIKMKVASTIISRTYYEDISSNEMAEYAIAGLAASTNDPYTGYLWGERAQSYLEEIQGDYSGVGLYIENNTEDNTITVVSPIIGSPAEAAGIVTGDKILKINGTEYTGDKLNDAVVAMKGPEGTEVTVTIRFKKTGEEKDITLTRQQIKVKSVTGEMLDNNVAYISITQFTENVDTEFKEVSDGLLDAGAKYLIIDLRNNPGGMLDKVVTIADSFVPDGEIITYTLDKNGKREEFRGTSSKKIKLPVAVLINGGSASASEILTGCLKDHNIAKIFGEKSFGKGVVQEVLPLGFSGILSITVARYYCPSGVCIHKQGIEPDTEVKMSSEKSADLSNLPHTEDDQLLAAYEYLLSLN